MFDWQNYNATTLTCPAVEERIEGDSDSDADIAITTYEKKKRKRIRKSRSKPEEAMWIT